MTTVMPSSKVSTPLTTPVMQNEFSSMEQRNFTLKNTQRKHSMRRRLLNQATYFSILDHTIYSSKKSTSSSGSSSEPTSPLGSPRRNSLPRSSPTSPTSTSPPTSPVSDPGSYTLTRRRPSIRHIECKRCEEKFETPGSYKQHVHLSENHNICNVCSHDYPSADHLGVHIRRSHWMCSLCPRLFPERKHTPYFGSKAQLEAHFVDNHGEQYCELCSCCFVSAEKKKEHIQEAHWACPDCCSGEKMPMCPEMTSDDGEDDSDSEDDFMMEMEEEDAFFKTREELEDHMFERHGEFYCGLCKDSLPSKSAQIKHMAQHPEAETTTKTSSSQSSVADQTKSAEETSTPLRRSNSNPRPRSPLSQNEPLSYAAFNNDMPLSPTSTGGFPADALSTRPRSIVLPANPYATIPRSQSSPRSPVPPLSRSSHSRQSSITSIAEGGEENNNKVQPSTSGSHHRRASSLTLRNQSVTPPPMSAQPPMKRQRSNTSTHKVAAAVKCC